MNHVWCHRVNSEASFMHSKERPVYLHGKMCMCIWDSTMTVQNYIVNKNGIGNYILLKIVFQRE